MDIRRRLLLQKAESGEQWDYILLPLDGSERGVFSTTKIPMVNGQTATIKYSGITTRANGHIIVDGYFASATFAGDCITGGQTTTLFQASKLTESQGTFTITAGRNGTITVGNSRTAEAGTHTAYACEYVKIRLN